MKTFQCKERLSPISKTELHHCSLQENAPDIRISILILNSHSKSTIKLTEQIIKVFPQEISLKSIAVLN